MPLVARWFVKTALVYLGASLVVGILIAAAPLLGSRLFSAALWMTYLHLMVVGWLTQLIFGVAIWLFPRYSKERPHGSLHLTWVTYVLLNVGLLLRAMAEPPSVLRPGDPWDWVMVASAVFQWCAVMVFVVYIWSRVRTK